MKFLFYTLTLLTISFNSLAVKIRGKIKDNVGAPLSFTTVTVKGETIGTLANEEGEFLLDLSGNKSYDIIFQALGYKTVIHSVNLSVQDIFLNVVMERQDIQLSEIKIGKSKEDLAYTIMRKAIAKSKIHDKQVDHYDADIYVKNTITARKIPAILKRQFEKQGVKTNTPFVSEVLLNSKFTQPNKKVTKVLAKKLSIDAIDIAGAFYLINLYNVPNSIDIISPLSPKSFSYYKFEYLGFFEDNGHVVNKIQVIPKAYGPGIFKGTIHIIDNLWCIHSAGLETIYRGINVKLNQRYTPMKGVWVPINQIIDVQGKPLGFDFTAKLQVNSKYNSLQINSKYVNEIKVLDEGEAPLPKQKGIQLDSKELTLKEFKKLNKRIEQEEKEAKKENGREIVTIDSVSRDSLMEKRSAEYWESIRSIPLTIEESNSYKIGDSIRVNIKGKETDTLVNSRAKNSLLKTLITGKTFNLNQEKDVKLNFTSPLVPFVGLNYNIVEGLFTHMNVGLKGRTQVRPENSLQYSLSSNLKYSFGMERFMAKAALSLKKGYSEISMGGGSFTHTFDSTQSFPYYVNTFANILKFNLTQLYLKEGAFIGYKLKKDESWEISTNFDFSRRSQLNNLPNMKLSFGDREPTPNNPYNEEIGISDFSPHDALVWSTKLSFTPGGKYKIVNGIRSYIGSDWPTFTVNYSKGLMDVSYDFLSLNINHSINMGPKQSLKYFTEVGSFLSSSKVYLMDMKNVNSYNFYDLTSGNFAYYRLLNTDFPVQLSPKNYYKYSTAASYIKLHVNSEFRKLLFTQIPKTRALGIKEDLFLNYLNTKTVKNYYELGYGIDGIFKLLRLEVLTNIKAGEKLGWGWKVGVTF